MACAATTLSGHLSTKSYTNDGAKLGILEKTSYKLNLSFVSISLIFSSS
ncbi:13733_t:CDS:2 [Entrophospora sp. SA101]|nr:13733_t:CDS:2 [Entrophospora sp. SA101]